MIKMEVNHEHQGHNEVYYITYRNVKIKRHRGTLGSHNSKCSIRFS